MEELRSGHEILEDSEHANGHGHHATVVSPEHRQRCSTAAAIYAVASIIIGLFAGLSGTEATNAIIAASDQYGYYQAKGVKGDVASDFADVVKQLKTIPGIDQAAAQAQIDRLLARAAKENADKPQILHEADTLKSESVQSYRLHHGLSFAAVAFGVAIVLCMLGQNNALRGNQFYWTGNVCAGVGGLIAFIVVPWYELITGIFAMMVGLVS